MKRRVILAGVLAAAGVAAAVWLLRPTDGARIHRAMAELLAAAEKTGPESAMSAVRRADRAAAWFAEDCEIRIDRSGLGAVASRTELRQSLFRLRGMLDTLRVTLHDESIVVSPDRTSAMQRFTARATARHHGDEESALQETEVEWLRTPDGWRIRTLRAVEAIRRID